MVNCAFRDDFGHLKLSQDVRRPNAAGSAFAHSGIADAHESLVRGDSDSRVDEGKPREREDSFPEDSFLLS